MSQETEWYMMHSRACAPDLYENRSPAVQCPFCQRWRVHSEMCEAMRYEWKRLKKGKHKKKHISEVPLYYLRFMVEKLYGNSDDLRMMLDELVRRMPDMYNASMHQRIDARLMARDERKRETGREEESLEDDDQLEE